MVQSTGKKHDNIKRAGNNQSAKIKIKSENIHEEKKKSITKELGEAFFVKFKYGHMPVAVCIAPIVPNGYFEIIHFEYTGNLYILRLISILFSTYKIIIY